MHYTSPRLHRALPFRTQVKIPADPLTPPPDRAPPSEHFTDDHGAFAFSHLRSNDQLRAIVVGTGFGTLRGAVSARAALNFASPSLVLRLSRPPSPFYPLFGLNHQPVSPQPLPSHANRTQSRFSNAPPACRNTVTLSCLAAMPRGYSCDGEWGGRCVTEARRVKSGSFWMRRARLCGGRG